MSEAQSVSRAGRLLGSYSFEDGSVVEIRVYGPVQSEDVLWALDTISDLKRRELADRKEPNQSDRLGGEEEGK